MCLAWNASASSTKMAWKQLLLDVTHLRFLMRSLNRFRIPTRRGNHLRYSKRSHERQPSVKLTKLAS